MDSLHRLEEIFSRFPGIGPRQARRFVYYLLNKSPSFISDFAKLVQEVKRSTSECDSCHRIFIHSQNSLKAAGSTTCNICTDLSRDRSILMVVARDSDFEVVERSGAYKGLYFILGGTVPILDKELDKMIRLKQLISRVSVAEIMQTKKDAGNSIGIKEIILSLSATPDGENTATIVKKALTEVKPTQPLKITVLGRGISTGAELEYVDGETIRNALRHRE